MSEWVLFNYPFSNGNCVMPIATRISGNDNVNYNKAYEIGFDLVNPKGG